MSFISPFCINCGRYTEGNTFYCASCNRINRKAEEEAKKEPKKRTRINRESKRRSNQNRQYAKDRKTYLNKHKSCVGNCGKRSSEIHHAAGRIERLLLDQQYWRALCHDCHVKAENNPDWAKENGLSLERLNK